MMVFIYTVLAAVIVYLLIKRQDDKSRAYRHGREEELDRNSPYIVKGFHEIYGPIHMKFNYKDLEKAKDEAKNLTTCVEFSNRVRSERAEVWYNEQLIQSYFTTHRIKIENIDGFHVNLYDGKILEHSRINIDLKDIPIYKTLTIRLTNNEVFFIRNPSYSIQDNSLRGTFVTYLGKDNNIRSQNWHCFPVQIIESVLDYQVSKH